LKIYRATPPKNEDFKNQAGWEGRKPTHRMDFSTFCWQFRSEDDLDDNRSVAPSEMASECGDEKAEFGVGCLGVASKYIL